MEHYPVLKMEEILTFVTSWASFKNIVPNEISQTQRTND